MATSHSYDYDLIVLGAGSGGVRAAEYRQPMAQRYVLSKQTGRAAPV